MKKKPTTKRPTTRGAPETAIILTGIERQAEEEARRYRSSGARTGGDLDADWQRADHVGEEAVGGSVATPDQDVVDELGDALGVPRAPDEEVGQTHVHRDMRPLLARILRNAIDPTAIISQRMRLDEAPAAYRMWKDKHDRCTRSSCNPEEAQ